MSFLRTKYRIVRHPSSKEIMGYLDRSDDSTIIVPSFGLVNDFVRTYNATSNYEMGIAVEIYDSISKNVKFALLYSWMLHKNFTDTKTQINYTTFRSYQTDLTNLDILEILAYYNK